MSGVTCTHSPLPALLLAHDLRRHAHERAEVLLIDALLAARAEDPKSE